MINAPPGCGDAVSTPAPVSRATVALTTATLTASADTTVKSGSPNQAYGSETYLRTQSTGNNRALVRFDQASVSAAVGAGTLVAALLELDITDNGNNHGA